MNLKRILVSQPQPSCPEKSPYFDLQRRFDLELTFKPFIRIETLSTTEFRAQKISIPNYTAIVFTSRTAVEHFFKLAEELRSKPNDEMQYFCLTEAIALYLQKFINFRKRKVHHSKLGKIEDLAVVMKKHNTEKFLMPVSEGHDGELPCMTKAKVKLTYAVMYRTVSTEFTPEEIASYDMLCFFTPAGIQSLFDNDPAYEQGSQCIALYGPLTAKAAEEHGLRIDAQGPTPELPSMASVLQKYLTDNK